MQNIQIQPIAANPTTKSQLVELQVGANQANAGARLYFTDQPQLRSQVGQMIFLQSIETFSVHAVPVSFLSTNPVAAAADIMNGALVLNVAGREDMQLIPLVTLNRILPDAANYVAGVRELYCLDNPYEVDWTKSYVQLAAAGTQTAFSYLFAVRYLNEINRPLPM